eukprot:10963541-Heterocapsa_arctica.AAC.1
MPRGKQGRRSCKLWRSHGADKVPVRRPLHEGRQRLLPLRGRAAHEAECEDADWRRRDQEPGRRLHGQ